MIKFKMLNSTIGLRLILLPLFLSMLSSNVFALEVNGIAIHSELGSEQFIAGLYLPSSTPSSSSVISGFDSQRLDLKIIVDKMSSRGFRRIWIEGMAINAKPHVLEAQASNMAKFSKILEVDFIANDTISIIRSPNDVRIKLNGSHIGTIGDDNFYNLFVRTFVGSVPLSSTFKSDLLANGKVSNRLLTRFEGIEPSLSRVANIKSLYMNLLEKEENTEKVMPSEEPKLVAKTTEKPTPKKVVVTTQKKVKAVRKVAPQVTPAKQTLATSKPTPKPAAVAVTPKTIKADIDNEISAKSILAEQYYIVKLKRWTKKNVTYPPIALKRGQQGEVSLRITIDSLGKVLNSQFLKESKYRSLNNAALKAVKKSEPYPKIPNEIKSNEYTFNVPFGFKLD